MSEVEDRLGELLRSAAPPSAGVPFELVHRQVRRRRAARWSVAATALVAAAVGMSVALLSPGAAPHRAEEVAASPSPTPPAPVPSSVDLSGAVPWVDSPAGPYQAPPTPTPAPTRPTGHARACTARDVAVRAEGRNGATGQLAHYMVFRNTSASTCVLSGYPHVVGYEPGHPAVTATAGSFFDHGSTANMAPGQETSLTVETDSECAAHPGGASGTTYHRLAITLPGGGTVRVDEPDGLDVVCGLHVSHFVVDPPADPAPAHDPLSDLTVALQLPPAVRAGSTLVYVAALTNPTDQPVSLDRCPSYVENSVGTTVPVKDAHRLNCAPVGAIPANGTVRFAMRLPIPADAVPGPLTLRWELALAPAVPPGAEGTVTVLPAAAAAPASASASDVLNTYLRDLVSGQCPAARDVAASTFTAGNGELCGQVKVSAFTVKAPPATPAADEMVFAVTLTTSGSSDGSIAAGTTTWFYDLKRQGGAWKLVGGGSGP